MFYLVYDNLAIFMQKSLNLLHKVCFVYIYMCVCKLNENWVHHFKVISDTS